MSACVIHGNPAGRSPAVEYVRDVHPRSHNVPPKRHHVHVCVHVLCSDLSQKTSFPYAMISLVAFRWKFGPRHRAQCPSVAERRLHPHMACLAACTVFCACTRLVSFGHPQLWFSKGGFGMGHPTMLIASEIKNEGLVWDIFKQ
jgi:hypothetical protein